MTPVADSRLVLIVDDSVDTRDMYAEFLTFSGFRVAQASNGFEAIEIAAKILPDAVLVDLSLPGLDGWEVIRRLRGDKRTSAAKILVLSGLDKPSRRDAAATDAAATYDAFLVKPCLPDHLARELQRVLGS
ncbi:MAG: response regulator [Acidobacteria bacterium]|nr:response regulator [Acidobacteriota bacterium]MBI3262252.1 response regulator [Acidobacteriota bacterium]